MKYLIALLLAVFATTLQAEEIRSQRLVVIGDSISAQPDSWPTHLQALHSNPLAVHSLVQGGRSIRSYEPPRDLVGFIWNRRSTAIYFLGTNDMWQTLPLSVSRRHLENHLSVLLTEGFDVLLVNIPIFGVGNGEQQAANLQMRRIISHVYHTRKVDEPRLHYFDLNTVWDGSGTWDGLHPLEPLSQDIAEAIYEQVMLKELL